MTREEQIKEASIAYTEANCPKAIGGDYFRNKINQFNTNHDFIEGAQWADKTILQEVLEWLEKITIDDADGCGHPIVSFISFDYKEQLLQSFKERFNIE